MREQYRGYLVSFAALLIVLGGMFAASFVFTKGQSQSKAHAQLATSARPVASHMVTMHTVNMQNVLAEAAAAGLASNHQRILPLLTGVSPTVYAQRKAAAAQNKNAPIDSYAISTAVSTVYTATTTVKFKGMADSSSICPPSGCQPPDQALAASSSWVFQGVNTSFAVYSTSGARQIGWPKTAKNFFGVPDPGSCSPGEPFLSDPRAFYDPKDGRFWAAILEAEGAFGVNICPEQTFYWIAVSQTSNPNGVWNIYKFNMAISAQGSCPTCAADFTEFGFDQTAIYFSGNMYTQNGSTFMYAETFSALKSTMEAGSSVSIYGFFDLMANGIAVDTIQPVENEASSGPGVGLLINSFDMNGDGTHDCVSIACSGLVVWAIANPGQSTFSVTSMVVSTTPYIYPPQADEPGCRGCIATNDTRISGTPVYQQGLISFAVNTGLNNGTQVVPAIFWGQVQPTISGGTIAGATVFQSGHLHFSGDRAAFFGALMATSSGNLLMVFDTSSSAINPSIMYATRRTTDTQGKFESAIYLKQATTHTLDQRWGDYEAASYDGSSTNNTWFSSQYSNGDWATYIGKVHF